MNKRVSTGGDLHIVIKRFRDTIGSSDNVDEPGIIKITASDAENIVSKLKNIELLLKKVAESSTDEVTALEKTIKHESLFRQYKTEQEILTTITGPEEACTSVASTDLHQKRRPEAFDGFPLSSLEAVIELNNSMGESEDAQDRVQRFLESTKEYARDKFTKALALFIDDETIYTMTWTGHREKYAMRDLKHLVEALWRTWFDCCDYGDFEREMKVEITKTHSRMIKRKGRK